MSPTPSLYGWELLYNFVQSKIRTGDDVLIVLAHWSLTKNAFRCIGVGADKIFNSAEFGYENLPPEWNSNIACNYALRYINNNNLYILCSSRSGDFLVLNLLRCSDRAVSSVTFEVDQVVKGLEGPLEKIVPNYSEVILSLKDKLIEPVYPGNQREVQTQTTPLEEQSTESKASQTSSNDHDIPMEYPARISVDYVPDQNTIDTYIQGTAGRHTYYSFP